LRSVGTISSMTVEVSEELVIHLLEKSHPLSAIELKQP